MVGRMGWKVVSQIWTGEMEPRGTRLNSILEHNNQSLSCLLHHRRSHTAESIKIQPSCPGVNRSGLVINATFLFLLLLIYWGKRYTVKGRKKKEHKTRDRISLSLFVKACGASGLWMIVPNKTSLLLLLLLLFIIVGIYTL